MVEFAINSTASSSIGFALFKFNGTMPKLFRLLDTSGTVLELRQLTQKVQENLMATYDAILDSWIH